jgi:hypothetical protein
VSDIVACDAATAIVGVGVGVVVPPSPLPQAATYVSSASHPRVKDVRDLRAAIGNDS